MTLKYNNMLDILIHQLVHIEFSDDTLLILQNFQKTILLMNLFLLDSSLLRQNTFFKVEENHQNNTCYVF